MLVFCPECGERFEIPGHEEANVAHKCPSCGAEFGAADGTEKKDDAQAPKLKFVSGGETSMDVGVPRRTGIARGTPVPGTGRRMGQKLEPDKCELGSEVSSDGAGVLFEAREAETGRPVLVRRLLPEGGSVADAQRWALGAGKLQNVRHQRLVSVLGVGLRDGSPHVVTERAAGQTLREMAEGRPLNARQAVQMVLQIVEALSTAHGAGCVHGDLKPSNVMIDPQGRARVTDFGMLPRARADGELVASPHVAGWMPFAAPELVREGPEAADERSDSYSIGALLYYMLTGKAPFEADDLHALEAAVLEATPVAPSVVNPKAPRELDSLVMRALEKDPAYRPANAQAIALDIRRIEKEGLLAAPRRRWAGGGGGVGWFKVAAVVAVFAGIGFGAYWFIGRAWRTAALSRAKQLLEDARDLEAKSGIGEDALSQYREAAGNAAGSREEAQYLIEYAGALLRAGKPADASLELERAAGLKSQGAADAKALLPGALASAGRVDAAREAWASLGASKQSPIVLAKAVEAGLEAADRLLGAGDARRASEVLGLVMEPLGGERLLAGAEARRRAALGDALAALGEPDKARAEYKGVLSDETTPLPARVRAAEGLERLASASLEIELTPEEMAFLAVSPLAQARYARTLLHQGHAEQAGVLASRALASAGEGTKARAWAELAAGEIAETSGDFDAATRHFGNATSIATKLGGAVDVGGLASVGGARIKLRTGRATASIPEFEAVARLHGTDARAVEAVAAALVGAGDAYRVTGQPGEAARNYQKVTGAYRTVRPSYLLALCGAGEIQVETRSREKARETFAALASEKGAGVCGLIGQMMNGSVGTADLLEAAAGERPDLAARAFYCAGLRRELDGSQDEARALFGRAVRAAGEVSWYRVLARERMRE